MRPGALVPASALAALVLAGCGSTPGGTDTVTVFAAASLTDVFGDVGAAFEQAEPAFEVELNAAGSSALREQILAGAPADVFASADADNMEAVIEQGGAGPARRFATNRMELAVPEGNPGGVEELADLADPDLLVGLCAPPVPCGAAGRQILVNAGVEASLDTEEPDVRALLTKLEAGELDVGIVYATDVASSAAVTGIPIPASVNESTDYLIAVVDGLTGDEAARAFVEFVLSPAGQSVLSDHGFGPP